MSGFAFSHQFSKRWLATPTPIKQAIIQELDDIVHLLQPDTDLDSYRFSVANLHDTVEELIAIERAHQEKIQAEAHQRHIEQQRLEQEKLAAEKKQAERLAAEQLEVEKLEVERLAAEKLKQQTLAAEKLAAERLAQAENQQQFADREAQDQAEIAILEQERAIAKQAYLSTTLTSEPISEPSTDSNEIVTDDSTPSMGSTLEVYANAPSVDTPHSAEVAVLAAPPIDIDTDTDTDTIKHDIIAQLQGYIDNYLLESMSLMNDDLNQWLKSEVEKQVNARLAERN